jgi:hypothetical protein
MRVLRHAYHHHRVLRQRLLHLAHDVLVAMGDAVADGGVQVLLVEDRSRHRFGLGKVAGQRLQA